MRVLPLLLAAAAVAAGCVSPLGTTPAGGVLDGLPGLPDVEGIVQVDAERWSGEPSILALADGTLLITGVGGMTRYAENPADIPGRFGQSYIWRSTDNGATWAFVDLGLPEPAGTLLPYRNAILGVEGDLAADETGRAYFVDLTMLAINGLATSTDSGATWTETQNPAVGLPAADRPWLAAFGDGVVYVKYLHLTTGQRVARSTDGGRTFAEDVAIPCPSNGPIAADAARRELVVACVEGTDAFVVRTGEGAMKWERLDVAKLDGGTGAAADFPVVAVAGPGEYVMAWREASQEYANGTTIRLAATLDAGATWTEPVDASPLSHTRVFPWVDATPDGKVAVVWYGTDELGNPDELDAQWHPMVAFYELGSRGLARTAIVRLVDGFVHEGTICTAGLACVLEGRAEDRRLLDFFEVDLDAKGAAHITWTDTTGDVPTVWYGRVQAP